VGHLQNLDRRFPDRTLIIRRLLRDDRTFRELCLDYEEALAALAYWRSPQRWSPKQLADYRRLVAELETKIEAMLSDQTFERSEGRRNQT